ncbi:MAG: hypothetical protein GY795_34335 [Desulfobacterales bacterium]|nr:hypothetical protein [Desulfobacterales bacterium]
MGKQYKGFSKKEHDRVAESINSLCKQLLDLSSMILPVYGVSSDVGKEIQKLSSTPNVMNKLKSKLDNAYFKEHGGRANDSPYYDGRGYA